MPFSLRIASYNIHKCRGIDRRVEPGRILEVVRAAQLTSNFQEDISQSRQVHRRNGTTAHFMSALLNQSGGSWSASSSSAKSLDSLSIAESQMTTL